jgi:hypothetical protein
MELNSPLGGLDLEQACFKAGARRRESLHSQVHQ